MDDVAGERRRKGDAFPQSSSSASFPALAPRGPGLILSPFPSGSSFLPSPPPAAAAIVLALQASRSPVASTLLAGAMDGGSGDALLVRRSKAKKRPPPAAPHAERREFGGAGGGDRFLALWRDYKDVLQETEAKKRRLESKKRRKLRLLAEVKFLRKKYEFLVKCNSQQPNYKLKGQARQIQSPVGINEASAFADHGVGTGVPSTSKNTNLDINQDSVMNDVGIDRRGRQGHPKLDNFDQDGVAEDTMASGVKKSVCNRDTGKSPSSDDKRTNSWQDRLALQA